ncbi:molybdopterin-dependent oxidoreductase [Mycobacterium sp. RTGN5]|uniref:molybdopterin-dependent oxidoreductase n=1 Tax=Mycobacterium sp. RTGN5 TaxID=3016522 RepID=UPI0029C99425|nr:molybdopterin-dependent oxidoreductase [Mycobacterium sp. RTGN5]
MSADWQPTACILCECNCGIVVQTEGRTLARIRGDKDNPASQGYTCNKALRLDHYQNNRARLTSPMRRRADGSYEEIDWDTAITEIAAGFRRIAETYGGEKIFYYGGGGQGNHLGGAYSSSFLKLLGSRYRSNALAQEKTGENWVDVQLYGGHTRGEFEHAEVSVFVGKNPWMSQSFPRARTVLNDIAKDPARSMVVVDPVITDTAKMADFHLRVKPGADAWCLAALAAVLVQENLCNEAFLAEHVHGAGEVREVLQTIPIGDYAQRSGVDEELLRAAARRIAAADSVAVFEDLGVQQAPNSTLCSYLNKLLWILTGSFAKRGGQHLHSSFAPLFSLSGVGRSPVTGAPIIAGLVPSNVVPQEILTDHPDRFRAMLVESANPAHSIADSGNCRAAFESLELLVVVDVAMTETARLAHYVLPAATQFEKPEATFFNFEFPRNEFHLRHPLFEPVPGTLAEPEIWARLVRALGVVSDDDLRPLRQAAKQGRDAYTSAFFTELAANPALGKVLPYVLYETLGPTLPDGLAGAAALWGLAQKAAVAYPDAVRRAGHADGNALFDAILTGKSGVTFSVHEYADDWVLMAHADRKIKLVIPEMLADIRALGSAGPELTSAEFPIVLSAGERRAFTANDILRDPSWRKRDADGALRVSVEDAEALGLVDGARARITTAAGSAEAVVEVSETMLPGHAALPNGFGLDFVDADGQTRVPGVAPNSLTSTDWRDPYAGTPWHKHVPARIEAVSTNLVAAG